MRNDSQLPDSRGRLDLGTHRVPGQQPAVWLLITIVTNIVKASFPNPSQDWNNPTRIGANMGFMLAPGFEVSADKGTGEININALAGDTVGVSVTSGSDNFEDSVLLYGMARLSGHQVFNEFNYQSFERSTVVPNSKDQPLPVEMTTESFWFYQGIVIAAGTEVYEVQFALYIRDANSGQPVLYGCFSWEAKISVQDGEDWDGDDNNNEDPDEEAAKG